MKILNLKKYSVISLFTVSATFTCFNPTYYAAWLGETKLDSFYIQKKLTSGQILQVELPLGLEEALNEIVNGFDAGLDKITRNDKNFVEESGRIKDGRAWKLVFSQDKTTKHIDCKLEFPSKR